MEAKYSRGPANPSGGRSSDNATVLAPGACAGLREFGLALGLAVFLVFAACGGEAQLASPPGIDSKLRVVTTTALLADFVRNVGGELVEVRSIVPAGADVHSFQTTPRDSIVVSRAQVIVSNGYGLDDFLAPVLENAKEGSAVQVIATENIVLGPKSGAEATVTSRPAGNAGQDPRDPHFWQNPEHAIVYVDSIADGLSNADPDNRASYRVNAADYVRRLRTLDLEIRETLNQVPSERRHLVSYHDAFGHLIRRYGWKASAFVAGDADVVSPGAVVQVMDIVRDEALPAVFVGPQFNSDVIRRSAQDAGVSIGTIYSGVSEDGVSERAAGTYIDMMRANARSLVELLR